MWKFSGNASISMCIHVWSFFLRKIFEMETTPTHLDLTLGMSSILQSLLVFSVIGMVYLQSWVRIFCCCLHHALVIGQANTSSMYNKYIIAYIHIYIYYDMIILMMFRKKSVSKSSSLRFIIFSFSSFSDHFWSDSGFGGRKFPNPIPLSCPFPPQASSVVWPKAT